MKTLVFYGSARKKGQTKALLDRFQMFWASEVRGDKPEELTKKGAGLVVGGAPFFNSQFTGSEGCR